MTCFNLIRVAVAGGVLATAGSFGAHADVPDAATLEELCAAFLGERAEAEARTRSLGGRGDASIESVDEADDGDQLVRDEDGRVDVLASLEALGMTMPELARACAGAPPMGER